nr:hypothetical protein [Acinetobacter sichuanensis]
MSYTIYMVHTELFCILDDFCKAFDESLEESLICHQNKQAQVSFEPF